MKNIKEYLKSNETDIKLYHKNGALALQYGESSKGYWYEYTYDSSGNELTLKNSNGYERGFEIEEMTMKEVCKALGKTIKITI